jgi:hypothetical protein
LGYMEWITLKYNSNGAELWARRDSFLLQLPLGSPTVQKLDASGGIYVTGGSQDSGTGMDYTTAKYDPQGNLLWRARYNGPGNYHDWAIAMELDQAGNAYVTGYSYGAGTDADIATIKYDSSGNERWVKRYNGPANWTDWGRGISVDSCGSIYVGGWSTGSGTSTDFTAIKYDSAGNELWVVRYDNPEHELDKAERMTLDAKKNIYLAGTSVYGTSSYDFAVVKLSPLPVVKGDLNLDGVLNLTDIVLAINLVFLGEPISAAPAAGDFNCDGLLTGVDVVILLRMFYLGVPAPC